MATIVKIILIFLFHRYCQDIDKMINKLLVRFVILSTNTHREMPVCFSENTIVICFVVCMYDEEKLQKCGHFTKIKTEYL